MSNGSPDNKFKIVFDTNIYISAFLKSGLSREIFELGLNKKIKLFCSPPILQEIQEKLKNKFRINSENIEKFINLILNNAMLIRPQRKLDIIKTDQKDNIILECAEAANANLIVSIDKHLLKIKKYKKIGIVHPKSLTWILPEEF